MFDDFAKSSRQADVFGPTSSAHSTRVRQTLTVN